MRHTAISVILASLLVLVTAYLPKGPDYSQYDTNKLQERYNIIQALVRPRPSYNKPKIGSAYTQQRGYNKNNYQTPSYNNNKQYYGAPQKAYAPAKNTGYATGYANAVQVKPQQQYGYLGYNGIRFGGGQVHPIFNNDLLYKNKVVNLGPYDSTEPIFIGGNVKSSPASSFRRSSNFQPQIDAYGNRPNNAGAYSYFG